MLIKIRMLGTRESSVVVCVRGQEEQAEQGEQGEQEQAEQEEQEEKGGRGMMIRAGA